LHHVLYSAASKLVDVRFGSHIVGMSQDDTACAVTFADGRQERFDIVVIAEGLRSTTRQLLWGEEGFHAFGVIYAATKIDLDHGLPPEVFQIFFMPGASVMLAPITGRQLLVQCYFKGTLQTDHPQEQIRELLRQTASRFPSRLRALVDQVADRQDMFCDNVGMVTLPALSKGRIVLLGDAGYCPTFLSGMGASLALLGARALSLAITKEAESVPAALQRFSDLIHPIISHYQENAADNVKTMLDTSPLHAILQNWIIRLSPPLLIVHRLAKQHDLQNNLLAEFEPADF
jgi:2-polyprenyl-6-methoxyphenol hydroxylase-like FAD-dependent oxidoreductase